MAPPSSLGTRSPPCALGNREGNVSQPANGDGLEAALLRVSCQVQQVPYVSDLTPHASREHTVTASFCSQWMLPGCTYKHTSTQPLLLLFGCFIVHEKM